MIAIGMWAHIFLNAIVCHTPTRNPIWGELRTLLVVISTAAVWMLLAAVTPYNG